MSAIFTIVFLAGLVGAILALVAVVRGRLRWARIGSRKAAAYVLAGSVVLFFVGAAGAGASGPQGKTNPPPASNSPQTSSKPPAGPVVSSVIAAAVTTTRAVTPAPVPVLPPPKATAAPVPPLVPPQPPAVPPSPLTCAASMSDQQPTDYTNTDVIVRTGVAGADVTTTAHYKTTDTTHQAVATSNGEADIQYYISRATPGYTVVVDITVTANGATRSCSTSFTPQG
jgi:hypothetical protein